MLNPSSPKLVIAGGGTGGHLYPAVAIARALQQKGAHWQIEFVGACGGLEEKIVPREGWPLHLIPIGKLHRSVGLWQRLRTILGMPWAAWVAWRLLGKLQPTVVLGVGGFASGPFLFMAALSRIPTALWEPNAYPGLANRLVAPWVDQCWVVFSEAQRLLRGRQFVSVGLPVRESIAAAGRISVRSKSDSLRPFRLLVFGGSQGARAINRVVRDAVAGGGSWLDGLQIVHQTGPYDFSECRRTYEKLGEQVQAFEFLYDMNTRLQWADLVICRAGASTVAEICASRKPAVFIPLPTAADNHQEKNAEVLVRAQAAEMILQMSFTPETFKQYVLRFKNQLELGQQMAQRLEAFDRPQAAEQIAELVIALARRGRTK